MSDATRTIAVIDGNSLMHRAFHAIRQPMNAPDGRSTNALFGFFNMFIKMVDTFHPDGVICAFDKGKPRVRMEMLPSYKAQRPPMDPDLRQQFPMVKDLLVGLKVPILEAEGWEGDDILGTLARQGEAAGCDMYLITGDREQELFGRYEENAYMWRMMKLTGHPETYLYEIGGYDHGAMAEPAFHILHQHVKKILGE